MPIEQLLEVDPDSTSSRWDREQGCSTFLVQCDLETQEVALFDSHMADVHDRKLGTYEGWSETTRGRTGRWNRRFAKDVLPVRGWRPPRLTEAGTPFEPKALEPGATVTWAELVGTGAFREERYSFAGKETVQQVEIRKSVERSGQVWSLGWEPKSVWVVPFELLEDELAVLVRVERVGGKLRHSQTSSRTGVRAAA